MAPYRIDLSEILDTPGGSLSVDGELPLAELEKHEDRVQFPEPGHMRLTVDNVGEGAFLVRGTVSADGTIVCSRCLTGFAGELSSKVEAMFSTGAASTEDAYPVEGGGIDVAPAVLEALMLDVPFAPVCSETCEGLCPVCGADRRKEPCECTVDESDPRLAGLKDWFEEGED